MVLLEVGNVSSAIKVRVARPARQRLTGVPDCRVSPLFLPRAARPSLEPVGLLRPVADPALVGDWRSPCGPPVVRGLEAR